MDSTHTNWLLTPPIQFLGFAFANSPTHAFLERNVAVLLRGVLVAFVLEVPERGDQLPPRLARMDHFVDEPARRRRVRIGEFLAELGDLLGAHRGGVGRGIAPGAVAE